MKKNIFFDLDSIDCKSFKQTMKDSFILELGINYRVRVYIVSSEYYRETHNNKDKFVFIKEFDLILNSVDELDYKLENLFLDIFVSISYDFVDSYYNEKSGKLNYYYKAFFIYVDRVE
jgi:hypothetical protein